MSGKYPRNNKDGSKLDVTDGILKRSTGISRILCVCVSSDRRAPTMGPPSVSAPSDMTSHISPLTRCFIMAVSISYLFFRSVLVVAEAAAEEDSSAVRRLHLPPLVVHHPHQQLPLIHPLPCSRNPPNPVVCSLALAPPLRRVWLSELDQPSLIVLSEQLPGRSVEVMKHLRSSSRHLKCRNNSRCSREHVLRIRKCFLIA